MLTYCKKWYIMSFIAEKRYLYFPNLSSCCYCCNSTAGCGVLEPNWAADATYVGNEIDHNGNSAEKFEKSGA